ncbi:MAG: hypothetical protein DMF04_03725 [Verrucomicrobia bacterium]|nr:MAG: hypothetical protein DMF04_03725 [Verrucomicrobiota bacterium]
MTGSVNTTTRLEDADVAELAIGPGGVTGRIRFPPNKPNAPAMPESSALRARPSTVTLNTCGVVAECNFIHKRKRAVSARVEIQGSRDES